MEDTAVQLAFFAIEEAIKAEPAIAAAIQQMFSKGIPTAADWANLRAGVATKTYGAYVPASELPPSETGQ